MDEQTDSSPSLKRQRSLRGAQKPVNYDMKHHPMDDIMRPKAAAKRRTNDHKIGEGFIISRSTSKSKSKDSDANADDDSTPLSKLANGNNLFPDRRRSSRISLQSERTPNCKMRHHPIDDALRPKTAVNSKANRGKESTESELESFIPGANDNRSPSADDESENDNIVNAVSTAKQAAKFPPDPNRRRSGRTTISADQVLNYDVKHHPMDVTPRPRAAAKRMICRFQSISIPAPPTPSTVPSPVKPSSRKTLMTPIKEPSSKLLKDLSMIPTLNPSSMPLPSSLLNNPYVRGRSLDWNKLEPIDRRAYMLQQGAPASGQTLSMKWSAVKKELFEFGEITLDELNSREGTEWLKARYESVRAGVELFFESQPEPSDKKNWTVQYQESFDVYDKKRGSKYWRHHEDSVVQPARMKASNTENGEQPEIDGYYEERAVEEGIPNPFPLFGGDDEGAQLSDDGLVSAQRISAENQASGEAYVATDRAAAAGTIIGLSTMETLPASHRGSEESSVTYDAVEESEATLVELMRGQNSSSGTLSVDVGEELTEQDELANMLSPLEEYLQQLSTRTTVPMVASLKETTSAPVMATERHSCDSIETSTVATLEQYTEISDPDNDNTAETASHGPGKPEKNSKTKKRKRETDPEIHVHEDPPGGTPKVESIVAMNPTSPGTDIPKENLSQSQGQRDHNSEAETRTPRSRRHRDMNSTPRGIPRVVVPTASQYHPTSLFGGRQGSISPRSGQTRPRAVDFF